MVTCLCNVSISCLCEKLYSGAHFHFLPFVLLKLVCVNVNNVCKHWQCNNVITNSSFFNSFNAFKKKSYFILFYFSQILLHFFTCFLRSQCLYQLLSYYFLVCFAFLVFLCTLVVKANCCYITCRTFYILFFLQILCIFSLTSFMYMSLIQRRKKYEVELHNLLFFQFHLFLFITFSYFLYFVCVGFKIGPCGDVHFFSSTMKRCYLRFFHIDLCFLFYNIM